MESYALFRLPGELEYTEMTQTTGQPLTFDSVESLNGQEGLVMSPFAVTHACPQPPRHIPSFLPARSSLLCPNAVKAYDDLS